MFVIMNHIIGNILKTFIHYRDMHDNNMIYYNILYI